MKNYIALVALLLANLTAAPAARAADICVSFESGGYCDALELSWTPGNPTLTGTWKNFDCFGSDAPVGGGLREGGEAVVLCADGNLCPLGLTWIFLLHFPNNNFDLIRWDGVNWDMHQYHQPLSVLPGACPLSAQADSGPLSSVAVDSAQSEDFMGQ